MRGAGITPQGTPASTNRWRACSRLVGLAVPGSVFRHTFLVQGGDAEADGGFGYLGLLCPEVDVTHDEG
jgi:hypothetical protein